MLRTQLVRKIKFNQNVRASHVLFEILLCHRQIVLPGYFERVYYESIKGKMF